MQQRKTAITSGDTNALFRLRLVLRDCIFFSFLFVLLVESFFYLYLKSAVCQIALHFGATSKLFIVLLVSNCQSSSVISCTFHSLSFNDSRINYF